MAGHTRRALVVALAAGGLVTAGVGGAAAPALAASGSPARPAQSSVEVQAGQPGLAPKIVRQATSATTTAAVSTRSHGARPLPQTATAGARTSLVPSATGAATQASTAGASPASRLTLAFNGVSSRDSEVTNFNLRFEPPDQGLCAGAGFVLEPVNSAYRIYKTNGTSIRGPFNVNDLFDEGAKEFTSDPRCWYDPTVHAWFATILFLNSTFTEGRIDIAVNPSSDPTGLWNEYQIDATFDGRDGEPNLSGCPCFGDQPRIGIDQTNLYVTTDEFSINGPQFHGGQIYAIDKSDLVSGAATAHFVRFGNLHLGGHLVGAPQPALSVGTPQAEYFLSELDPNGNGDTRIGVWAMTNRGRVATGGSPTLSKMIITPRRTARRRRRSSAARPAPSTPVTTGCSRRRSSAARCGASSVRRSRRRATRTSRAGAAWFQVRPKLAGNVLGGATMVRQGYVSVAGANVLYPAVQPDAAGNAAMVFTLTGHGEVPERRLLGPCGRGLGLLRAGGRDRRHRAVRQERDQVG